MSAVSRNGTLAASDELDHFDLRSVAHGGRVPIPFTNNFTVEFDGNSLRIDFQVGQKAPHAQPRRDLTGLAVQ